MFLIVGLGNPEKEYKKTRHNIGFEVINKLAFDHSILINRTKHHSHFGEGIIASHKVIIAKPQTYMNLSGEAVRDFIFFYKLSLSNLIVIYDDVSFPPGEIRIRNQGSAGGHNGLKNIIYHLETDIFTRVRVGIGSVPDKMILTNFVLSHFKKDEFEHMLDGISKASAAVEMILQCGALTAMNQFNKVIKNKGSATV